MKIISNQLSLGTLDVGTEKSGRILKGRTQAIGSFVYSTQSISKLWESGGGVVGVTHASKTTTTLLCRADVLRTMGYPLEMKDDYVRSFPIYV